MTLWTLWCRLFDHLPFVYDRLPDGTKIRGCNRCGAYIVRDGSDPRPLVAADARFRMPRKDQTRARWASMRSLRSTPKSDTEAIVRERYRSAS